eukprot:m51a1_g3259 hypothetical protein (364) ;mRNA; r:189837-191755
MQAPLLLVEEYGALGTLCVTLAHPAIDDSCAVELSLEAAPGGPSSAASSVLFLAVRFPQQPDAPLEHLPPVSVPLRFPIDLESVSCEPSAGFLCVSAKYEQQYCSQLRDQVEWPPEVSSLYCRTCGAALTDAEHAFRRVRSMPSSSWEELSEAWVCDHDGHGTCSALTCMRVPGQLTAVPRELFCGRSFVIAHADDAVEGAVVAKGPLFHLWSAEARCARCLHTLGEVAAFTGASDSQTEQPSVTELTLRTCFLSTAPSSDGNRFAAITVESQCASDILDACKDKGCFKFLLSDAFGSPITEITLVASLVLLSSHDEDFSTLFPRHSSRAIKVTFSRVEHAVSGAAVFDLVVDTGILVRATEH